VWRAPDVSDMLDGVGRGVDETHGIRSDRDHRNGAMVGRKSQAVHQQLAPIEGAEAGRQRIAKPNHTEKLVVDGVGDRNRVRELLRGVDAIAMTDRDVRIGGSTRDLPGRGALRATENCRSQESCQTSAALHITAPWLDRWVERISIRSAALTAPALAKVGTAAAADRRRGAWRQSPAAGSR
jgi:hypothetical protein